MTYRSGTTWWFAAMTKSFGRSSLSVVPVKAPKRARTSNFGMDRFADWVIAYRRPILVGSSLFALALVFRVRRSEGWLFTLSLAQAGEFGFVLLGYSVANSVVPPELRTWIPWLVDKRLRLTYGCIGGDHDCGNR